MRGVGRVLHIAARPKLVGGVLRLRIKRRPVGDKEADMARIARIIAAGERGEAVAPEPPEVDQVGSRGTETLPRVPFVAQYPA